MTLPKIDKPLFSIMIPSLNKECLFRPFVVREEKILLTAQQSGQEKDIIMAIKQVINNCIQDETVDVNGLALFDLEYLFIKLRARSVNNVVKLSYRDREDEKTYDFEVDLDEVEMLIPATASNNIMVTDTIGIVMKYPSVDIVKNIPDNASADQALSVLMRNCIKDIYDEDTVYNVADYTEQELQDFIDDLQIKVFDEIRAFFESAPRVYHKLTYTNSLGNERIIELNSINDFFTWG